MAGKKDIKLDPTTHDILIENSDFQMVSEGDWLVQSVKIKMLFFLGEWFLDTTYGLDHFGLVLIKGPDLNLIDNMIKIALLEYDEIIEILEYTSSFDKVNRKLTVDFRVSTVFGELSDTVSI
jgi:hypothetical protein